MRLVPLFLVATSAAGAASAQVADTLARHVKPNAIDRSLSASPTTLRNTRTALDQQRRNQSARAATAWLRPPPTSTTLDRHGSVQRPGGGALPPSATALPASPQP